MPHKDPEAKRAYDRAYGKAWRKAHPEQKRADTTAWRKAHPERSRELNRAQKGKDRDKIRQRSRASYHALRDKDPALFANRAEQARRRSRAHYYANREAKIAYQREYHCTHAETVLAYHRDYYQANKPSLTIANKLYRQTHPDVGRTARRNRDARISGAPINDLTHAQWLEIQTAQDHRCYYCGKRCKDTLTQDHIQALSKGGSHTLHNVIGACVSCNSKKHIGPPPTPVQPLLLTIAPARKKKVS